MVISETVKWEMSETLASSVQTGIKSYNGHFKAGSAFLKAEVDLDDLKGVSQEDKTLLLSLTMLRRRQA